MILQEISQEGAQMREKINDTLYRRDNEGHF